MQIILPNIKNQSIKTDQNLKVLGRNVKSNVSEVKKILYISKKPQSENKSFQALLINYSSSHEIHYLENGKTEKVTLQSKFYM